MDRKTLIQAAAKFLAGVVLEGALLFIPAGTLAWPQGWRLMVILFVPMLLAGIVMIRKNPELLKKRLNAKEEQKEQQDVVKLSGLMFLAAFILAGLNYRFGWIILPDWISWVAAAIFLISYGLYAEVMRENAYLSRTVEVQENQKVIEGDRYGLIRDCPSSDVHEHAVPVSGDAAGTGLPDLFSGHAAVYPDHCQTDPERGTGAGGRAAGLYGI